MNDSQFVRRFDALRNRRKAKLPSHCDHVPEQTDTALIVLRCWYERAIDLQLVERIPGEIAEVRVSRAEIVDRQRDPLLRDLIQGIHCDIGVAHGRAFGNLEHYARRV